MAKIFSLDAMDETNAPSLNEVPISRSSTALNIPDYRE